VRRVGALVFAMLAADSAGVAAVVLGFQHESLLLLFPGIVGIVAALYAALVLVEITA